VVGRVCDVVNFVCTMAFPGHYFTHCAAVQVCEHELVTRLRLVTH
jgi:hypothetical protein